MAPEALALHLAEQGRTYDLCADVTDTGDLRVDVVGSDSSGRRLAVLRGTVAGEELEVVARMLASAAKARQARRPAHRNASLRWSSEDDERLRELAAAPGACVSDLMAEFGRSRLAIEMRMAKLGIAAQLPYRRARGAGAQAEGTTAEAATQDSDP
ncbi:hypothetical protein [Thermoactinospora rubra]|uniref:hypothetical protein n=1 Tax=Thermoactinospora rubra TaxID=1088767 RepID=UPI000A0FA5E1|nr:hypothetical protein [Thermoactinospora rubra]